MKPSGYNGNIDFSTSDELAFLPLMVAFHVAALVESRHGFVGASGLHLPEESSWVFALGAGLLRRIHIRPGRC